MASAAEQLASNLNFSTFAKAEDLKKRLWFTLAALLVYRLGTHIPLPGLNPEAYAAAFQGQSGGILGLFNMFAGGAVERMAIFALGIMPYISASIIVQLMTSVVPALEQLKKEGEQGRKIINQYTRYGTVLLGTLQAYGIAVGLESGQGIVADPGWFFRISTVLTLLGGTMFLMWLGEQITSRGIGNGISLIIFAGIVAGLPGALIDTMRQVSAKGEWTQWCVFFLSAVESQAIRNLTIAENIRTLYEEMKQVFADTLSSKWSMNALDFVFSNPIFRNNRFTSNAGIPVPTAARFTRALLDNKIIHTLEEASGRRPALYSFEPLMNLLRV